MGQRSAATGVPAPASTCIANTEAPAAQELRLHAVGDFEAEVARFGVTGRPALTFELFHKVTDALTGELRAAAFYALPAEWQRAAWDDLAAQIEAARTP